MAGAWTWRLFDGSIQMFITQFHDSGARPFVHPIISTSPVGGRAFGGLSFSVVWVIKREHVFACDLLDLLSKHATGSRSCSLAGVSFSVSRIPGATTAMPF